MTSSQDAGNVRVGGQGAVAADRQVEPVISLPTGTVVRGAPSAAAGVKRETVSDFADAGLTLAEALAEQIPDSDAPVHHRRSYIRRMHGALRRAGHERRRLAWRIGKIAQPIRAERPHGNAENGVAWEDVCWEHFDCCAKTIDNYIYVFQRFPTEEQAAAYMLSEVYDQRRRSTDTGGRADNGGNDGHDGQSGHEPMDARSTGKTGGRKIQKARRRITTDNLKPTLTRYHTEVCDLVAAVKRKDWILHCDLEKSKALLTDGINVVDAIAKDLARFRKALEHHRQTLLSLERRTHAA